MRKSLIRRTILSSLICLTPKENGLLIYSMIGKMGLLSKLKPNDKLFVSSYAQLNAGPETLMIINETIGTERT